MSVNKSYMFSTEPRALHSRRKYRDPSEVEETVAKSLMNDPRVIRGSTYSSMYHKTKESSKDNLKSTPELEREFIPPTKSTIYDLRPNPNPYIPVDLTLNLIEQRPSTPKQNATTQTDLFSIRPPTPEYVPHKTGIDVAVQVGNDLFNFDFEVEPILQVLVDKTLEQSLLEVEQETELREIRLHRVELERVRKAEADAIKQKEQEEINKFHEKERRLTKERAKAKKELALREKIAASAFGRAFVENLQEMAFSKLENANFFIDQVEEEVKAFMPWILGAAGQKATARRNAREMVELALKDACIKCVDIAKSETERREEKKERNEKQGFIRIFVRGSQIVGAETIGPIQFSPNESISQVETKVSNWLREHIGEFEPPPGGFIRLAYEGQVLDEAQTLIAANVKDLGTVELKAQKL